jgi:hypothetical protein
VIDDDPFLMGNHDMIKGEQYGKNIDEDQEKVKIFVTVLIHSNTSLHKPIKW